MVVYTDAATNTSPEGFPTSMRGPIPVGTRAASIEESPGSSGDGIQADRSRRRYRLPRSSEGSSGETEIQNWQEEWHFKTLADAAAARKPDWSFIRETMFIVKAKVSDWNTWDADFFQPANNLLRRPLDLRPRQSRKLQDGGAGWFYLLEARPYRRDMDNRISEPYVVNAGNIPVLVDSIPRKRKN